MSEDAGFQLRNAREEDRVAIRDLTFASYEEYATRMAPTAWAALKQALAAALASDEPADRIVAERDGELVGSVMLYARSADAYEGAVAEAHWPEVRLLAVTPAARGDGVGAALMGECIRRARAAGATEIGLHTSRSMEAAIRMYERFGFVRYPDHDFQPEGGELVTAYRLQLNEPGRAAAPGALTRRRRAHSSERSPNLQPTETPWRTR